MKDGTCTACVLVLGCFSLNTSALGQVSLEPAQVVEASAAPQPEPKPPAPFTPSPEFQAWLTDLVREHLPHQYERKKNWGHTERRFTGVSVRLDDGRLKTHRKFDDVNDSRWTMYRVKLADPEEQFDVEVSRMEELEGGRVAMDLAAVARLDVFGRQSLWTRGVQVFSLSADADAKVRLTAHAEIATRLDPTVLPPDVHLAPTITSAKLEILDFRLRRISQAHGPLVRSLSHTVREALEDKLAEDNEKLVAKLNKSLAKQQGKLKLSLTEIMQARLSAARQEARPPEPATSRLR
ncbi:MAG: hypothetical protein L0211_15595 [Planctomycetaceae bacterium]|nr:hypothetical protein [Planctomycetaceae bacterium]